MREERNVFIFILVIIKIVIVDPLSIGFYCSNHHVWDSFRESAKNALNIGVPFKILLLLNVLTLNHDCIFNEIEPSPLAYTSLCFHAWWTNP